MKRQVADAMINQRYIVIHDDEAAETPYRLYTERYTNGRRRRTLSRKYATLSEALTSLARIAWNWETYYKDEDQEGT